MNRPYVEQLRIQNYGCIQDATVHLTPLHALVGPNDSGKSTILRALQSAALFRARVTGEHDPDEARLIRAWRGNKEHETSVVQITSKGVTWQVRRASDGDFYESDGSVYENEGRLVTQLIKPWISLQQRISPERYPRNMGAPIAPLASELLDGRLQTINETIDGAVLVRLDPDAIRMPSPLLPQGAAIRFSDDRGSGLPGVFDAILNTDFTDYAAINAQIHDLFPTVRGLSPTNPTPGTKALGINLLDGTHVPADMMSEGLLYFLAFLAIRYMKSTALLLVEEPENGLHPARIADVMKVLRKVSETTQVLIATHSPLVINELQPDEVSVVTRPKDRGTQVTRLKDTPNFEERAKVYALGELWLSYANGVDEGPLLNGGPRP